MNVRDAVRQGISHFENLELPGSDLRNLRLEFLSFAGANLDRADFTGASLHCVDLSNASLAGATLCETNFRHVDLSNATLTRADASGVHWTSCDLTAVRAKGLVMARSFVRNSTLQRGNFDRSDLRGSRIAQSDCSDASFLDCDFEGALTMGSRFRRARFDRAKNFARCREIVAEILRDNVGNDFELQQLVGAVLVANQHCYAEWNAWLQTRPRYLETALDAFGRFPASGCAEALRTGLVEEGELRRVVVRSSDPAPRAESSVARGVPQLDALAPHWELFEGGGFDQEVLVEFLPELRSPVVHIGGGRGSLAAEMRQDMGSDVVHIDLAHAMCRRALDDFGLASARADVGSLPFPTAQFASVVCSSGVLEFLNDEGLRSALREVARVGKPGALVVLAGSCAEAGEFWRVDQHDEIERWYRDGRGTSLAQFDELAMRVGSRDEARRLLLLALPRFGSSIERDALLQAASAAGLAFESEQFVEDLGVWKFRQAP